ncbi:septal ring lytic transglycosylase RlpA family protein [Sabulicella glaciei]|uniref:Endolytic peptidoglycan transglycosylase RlpA n=1 Tax=Sabulicella glaciei TaxID=2984948 RepID=A0ABT3NQF8_9PROT|nr:septal ring lytic transglycosylase RlpA family protein [Roseococcus sp. MDT2-1-1]MCW8084391.1 septal ring lytic transglycosylase RlpA family protein [Roseococcus sp. MDT2-1-1]
MPRASHSSLVALMALGLAACQSAERPARPPEATGPAQRGEGSYYSPTLAGRPTASGERFDPDSDTAAHPSLPLGTVAEVRNLRTGRAERVTIRDRGPFRRGRIIDVSPRTAERLGMKEDGTAPVEVRPVSMPGGSARQ